MSKKLRTPFPFIRGKVDLPAAFENAEVMSEQSPTNTAPALMIESMRVYGSDRLTATDQALYQAMVHWARHKSFEAAGEKANLYGEFEFPRDMVRGYLQAQRWDDVEESVRRISDTKVHFVVRKDGAKEWGAMPLATGTFRRDKGETALIYSFPAQLARLMSEFHRYAKLELAAFPKFTSKYSARLYQRFALRAGYGAPYQTTWEIAPEALASEIGWKPDPWSYGAWARRVLYPALEDIAAHVTRFSVQMTEVRGAGRGRKVEKLVFAFARKKAEEPDDEAVDVTMPEAAPALPAPSLVPEPAKPKTSDERKVKAAIDLIESLTNGIVIGGKTILTPSDFALGVVVEGAVMPFDDLDEDRGVISRAFRKLAHPSFGDTQRMDTLLRMAEAMRDGDRKRCAAVAWAVVKSDGASVPAPKAPTMPEFLMGVVHSGDAGA